MKIINNPTNDQIADAAESLINGKLVVFPTETVYGLGGNAENFRAVKKIYQLKNRPMSHPLIVHISNIDLLDFWAKSIPNYVHKLIGEFWPGPLTLILDRTSNAKDFITGFQDSVAIRIPDNFIALTLLSDFEKKGGHGIVAPSANRFGRVSPTSARDAFQDLHEYDKFHTNILDGGNTHFGTESTILDCRKPEPRILRVGALNSELISNSLGRFINAQIHQNDTKHPGLHSHHYAPNVKIKINYIPQRDEGFLALQSVKTPEGATRVGSPVDALEFTRNLYSYLRLSDQLKLKVLCVHLPEKSSLTEVLWDRVSRASND